jgi:hypothetical protein
LTKYLPDRVIETTEDLMSHLIDAIDADFIEIELPEDDNEQVEAETTWAEAGFSIVDGEVLSVPLTTESIDTIFEEEFLNG